MFIMSENKEISATVRKSQKRKRSSGPNKSKVRPTKKKTTLENKNETVFANITHKKASGANNWSKFSELLKTDMDKKNKISNPASLATKQHRSSVRSKPIDLTVAPSEHDKVKKPRYKSPGGSSSAVNQHPVISKQIDNSKPKITKHIAMDCEMVGVEMGVNKNMLARISIVNSDGDCVYDKFVKPTERVVDYRTKVSGVRPKDLEHGTDFKTVQEEVADILKSRILIGHALKNDLKVLFLSHPKHSMRDTSKFKKFREGKTPALKKLAKKYLGATIQAGEHSSVQDALAAMQLYKMFKKEWEASIYSKKHKLKKGDTNKSSVLNLNDYL